MQRHLDRLRESFWFIPAVMVLGALLVAQGLITIDRGIGGPDTAVLPESLLMGVDGSRGLLATLAAAILGVAGTTFSITISVIATASSSYGPRLVRNFIADRSNQLVLGTFVATFVYCLMVLRSIQAPDSDGAQSGFVPYLAVWLAMVLALLNVAALVYFLHHIADSIQISYLIDRVRREFLSSARAAYGDDLPDRARSNVAVTEPTFPILAARTGFLVAYPEARLIATAREADCVAGLSVPIGTHVIPGEVIGWTTSADSSVAEKLASMLSVDDARTPKDDIHYAVQQVIEIAVRALSPGTNDPYTARNVLAELGEGMSIVAATPRPPLGRVDEDDVLRLVLSVPPAVDVIDDVFDDLRTHAYGDPRVIQSTLNLAERLLVAAGDEEVTERVRQHVTELLAAFTASGGSEFDRRRLHERVEQSDLLRAPAG